MALPLEGMKVLELGFWVLGPICARILGELGADVIKIEDPTTGDPLRGVLSSGVISATGTIDPFWELCNRGKRDMALDLTTEKGRGIIYELAKRSDVFITNYRASVVDRLGFDYKSIAKINPKIIYAQATGFGLKGPHRNRHAFDETAFWIRSGIMSTLGEPDSPPVPLRGAMGDITTGTYLAGAIVTALLARERFGIGQKVDISLMASGMWVAGFDVQGIALLGLDVGKFARKHAGNPLYNTYEAKDGKWFQLVMLETDRYWPSVCKAIEREDLEKDPRFDTHVKRCQNSELLISMLDEIFATKTRAEWAERFEKLELIWEPETKVIEVIADPQVSENEFFIEAEHTSGTKFKLLRPPFQFSETSIRPKGPAPEHGQHTEEILLELGYDWDRISKLKEEKVII